jgi:glucose-6-phosphate isomerase
MLAPSTTLFVIASKTFTTLETISNAQRARLWLENAGMESAPHLVAVTAAPGVAVQWGVPAEQCLHFFDWVGGRFSLSSVIGFSVLCAMGERSFTAFLEGMHDMDTHVLNAPLGQNLAVVHGLMWWLNSVVLQRMSIAVVPYSHDLRFLPAFLQQLMMESNGKSVHVDGSPVDAPTSPVVWGATGTDSQHAFFQMLHQGPQVIPVEFIGVVASTGSDDNAHLQLNANLFAQAQALAAGKLDAQGHKNFAGNRPSTVLMLDELSPRQLGALIAMYEHSCAVQGWLMGINSFDQWGVELGKVLAHDVAAELETGTLSTDKTMTHPLLEWYLRARKKLLPK